MNNLHRYVIIAIAASFLAGCSATSNISNNTASSDNGVISTETPGSTDTETDQSNLPVLHINTKSTDPDVMDFVNVPVAKHVSEDIITWDPTYKIPPEPYYEECTITLDAPDGSSLLGDSDAKVKVRGNWTTIYDKKPHRIKFTEKQNLLGLNDGAEFKNWVLLAEYKDASMLRNKAALYASREILGEDGLYAADSELVQVDINGEYMGIYLLTEFQQADDDRVDVTTPEKDYTGTDTGYFLEFDGYFSKADELQSFPLDLADNAPLVPFDGNGGSGKTIKLLPTGNSDFKRDMGITIKSDIYSEEQHDFIESYINNIYRIMYEAAYNDKAFVFNADNTEITESNDITPREAVEKVINTDSLADMYIISELTCDADIHWSSFYMDVDLSKDHPKKLTFEAPWDFDSSMGNRDRCEDSQGFYASNIMLDCSNSIYETANPWLMVLAYEEWYQDIVKDKWTKAYDSGVFDRTYQLIEEDTKAYKDDFIENYHKWDNIIDKSAFEMELSKRALNCYNHEKAAEYLLEWLQKRVDFLNSQWHK